MDQNDYPVGLGNLPSQGYGLATCMFVNDGNHYPTGTYTLTFDGAGTVDIVNFTGPVQVFSQNGGLGTPFNVNIPTALSGGIVVAITSSDPADYVRNIRLVMPGLESTYQTQPFNPQYLSTLQGFSYLRFGSIGVNNASWNEEVGMTWADETPVTYRTQAKTTGESVEYMVDLCNELHENMWVNMPVGSDSTYLTNFATYVKDNLDPGLKVYVEYGNEVWNSGYTAEWNYVSAYATANSLTTQQATADLTANCWNIWRQVFTGQTSRMVRVLATQFDAPFQLNPEIARLVATSSPSDPNHGFDIISEAPYFGPNTSSFNSQTTVQQIEAAGIADLNGPWSQNLRNAMQNIENWEVQLNQQIPVIMYEGGWDLSFPNVSSVPWENAFLAAQTDPGMFQVTTAFLTDLANAGVTGINYTTLAATPNQWGEFGSIIYIGEPSSETPKYNALVSFINSPSLVLTGFPVEDTAGAVEKVTVTAYGPNGSGINSGYTGTVTFSSSDPQASLPSAYTFTAADAGVHTFTIALKTAGYQSITVSDTTNGLSLTQSNILVNPAGASILAITGFPATVTAGAANNFTVTAYDPYGNVATGYLGTIAFSSSDSQAGLPANYTFTSGNAGTHTFTATLNTVGTQTIYATDTVTATVKGSATATVSTTATAAFVKSDTTTEGNWEGIYGTQGYDLASDAVSLPSYATVTLPGQTPYTWASSSSATPALETPGSTNRVAACWDASSSFAIAVNLNDGQAHDIALYALDWNVLGRSEQIQISSAATGAILSTQTISNFSSGVYLQWNVTGDVVITVTREASPNAVISGLFFDPSSSAASQSTASQLTVSAPTAVTAGSPFSVTVTAKTSNGNVATGYTGTIAFSSSDSQAGLPANYTFTSGNAGTHTFTATLNTVGTQTIYATDTVTATVKGSATATVSSTSTATAAFVKSDTTTEGNWEGIYGTQGYDLASDAVSLPSYATVTLPGQTPYTWASSSSATPALETPGSTNRVAACWNASSSFAIAVNLNDGQAHDIALYALDWNVLGRSEQIQISSAATGAILSTQTISNFSSGVYLQWNVTGDVVITVTREAGPNAVISGLFFDPSSRQPVAASQLTVSAPTAVTAGSPFSVTVTAKTSNGNVATGYTGTIAFSSSDSQAGLPANYTFTSGNAGTHTFTATLNTVGTQTIYATDTVTATVKGSATATVSTTATAAFVKSDTTTEGNWEGIYGTQGYDLASDAVSLPSYATVTLPGQTPYTWASSSSATPALETPGSTNRVAACWDASSSFAIAVNLNDGQAHDIALYALDWNVLGRSEQIQISSAATGAILSTQTISNFSSGVYLQWNVTGDVVITVTREAGPNAVISGLFFDPSSSAASQLTVSAPTAVTAGSPFSVTVTAKTSNGNVATGYLGTIAFSSSDSQACLPANFTLVAADHGTYTLPVRLKTAGTQYVPAIDTTTSSITGTQSGIVVQADGAQSLAVTGFPTPDVAGAGHVLTITAYDAFRNVATGYTGTVQLSSSDPQDTWPTPYTFSAAGAGTLGVLVWLKTAGVQSITATDTTDSSLTGTESNITVQPGAAESFKVTGCPNPDSAGVSHLVTVTAYDAYGNVATGYLGTVNFSSTDSAAGLPASYTFLASDNGSHVFSITLNTKGTRSITVTDSTDNISGSETGIIVQ